MAVSFTFFRLRGGRLSERLRVFLGLRDGTLRTLSRLLARKEMAGADFFLLRSFGGGVTAVVADGKGSF